MLKYQDRLHEKSLKVDAKVEIFDACFLIFEMLFVYSFSGLLAVHVFDCDCGQNRAEFSQVCVIFASSPYRNHYSVAGIPVHGICLGIQKDKFIQISANPFHIFE
jgi:hypothetical protein